MRAEPSDELGRLVTDLSARDPHMTTLALSAPWGARNRGSDGHPGLYVIASGSAWLAVDGAPAVALEAGDVAVLPRGTAHVIASAPDLRALPIEEFCATASVDREGNVVGGGGGAHAELHTLCFRVEGAAARAVTAYAPPLVVVRGPKVRPWLAHVVRATLDLAAEEARARDAAARRLGEMLLLEALRGSGPARVDCDDPIALRAAVLLRSHLDENWTVAGLARRVGLSRTVLFDRFVRAHGCSPGAYLLRARMEEAALLLVDGARSVDEVAAAVGYRWPSSFAVAFRRHHGVPPTVYARGRRARRS